MTIIMTTDLSEESQRAFVPTMELARQLHEPIVLLHVVPEHAGLPHGEPLAPSIQSSTLGAELQQAQEALDTMAQGLEGDVKTAAISGLNVAEAIASYAEENGASFIALSTHGRTGFRRLVLGSIAEGVMRHATIPVICFPQK
tara:strand:- start:30 stop:458 length:429 start_codon:yes stop_codon:yes gene_type:complete